MSFWNITNFWVLSRICKWQSQSDKGWAKNAKDVSPRRHAEISLVTVNDIHLKNTNPVAETSVWRAVKYVRLLCFVLVELYHKGYVDSLIARSMGSTWGPSGADRTQGASCWPHELCYLGCFMGNDIHSPCPLSSSHMCNECRVCDRVLSTTITGTISVNHDGSLMSKST